MTAAAPAVEASANQSPCLIKISPLTSSNNLIELNSDCSFGESSACSVSLVEDHVSELHATIQVSNNRCVLMDQSSVAGTFANSSKIIEHPLRDGDQIQIGDAVFKFFEPTNSELNYHRSVQGRINRDGLTHAYNKGFMHEFLERELNRCSMHDRPLSVLMMDIDFFKQANDVYGHLAGDQVLCEFTKRIAPLLDADDIFARYGGEEFAVVMCENDLQDALVLANQIREAIAETPFLTHKAHIDVTVSIGISGVTGLDEVAPKPQELIEKADQMLYRAKGNGRNRVEL